MAAPGRGEGFNLKFLTKLLDFVLKLGYIVNMIGGNEAQVKSTRGYKMKSRVIKLLVKWGNNENEVLEMVEKNFDYTVKTYPEAKAAFIADVVSALR